MASHEDTARIRQAIYAHGRLEHFVEIPILGVPVRFESNVARVVTLIAGIHRAWQPLASHPELLSAGRIRIQLLVADEQFSEESRGVGPRVRATLIAPDVLCVTHPSALGYADVAARAAWILLATDSLADETALRYGVLDTLTLFLVTTADRQPFHAAAIRRGPVALLLTGSSGAGKSTLSYAALRAGFHVMSDDAVYVQQDPVIRIWSFASRLHLPAAAVTHFAELAETQLVEMTNGKTKHIVEALNALPADALPFVERAGVCILVRSESARPAEPITPEEAVSAILAHLDPGFDRFRTTIGDCMRRVASVGAWRFYVSGTPSSMLPQIHQLLTEVEHGIN